MSSDPPSANSSTDATEPIYTRPTGDTEAPTVFDAAAAKTRPAPARQVGRPEVEADFGPYRLGDRLPSRLQGDVYVAQDVALDREVVLWIPPPTVQDDPATRDMLLHEARTLAQLTHPHLQAVYSIERGPEGQAALAVERVSGRRLSELLAAGELDPAGEEWPRYLAQAALGLQAAAKQGILHRDMSPDHLVLRPGGQLVVTHFALGGLRESAADGCDSRQLEAPELRDSPSTTSADLYALGATFCQLLNPGASGSPSPGHDCDPRLARVLRALTSTRPESRPDYDALLDMLEPLLPGEIKPVSALKRIGAAVFDLLIGMTVYYFALAVWAVGGGEIFAHALLIEAIWWLVFLTYNLVMIRHYAATIGLMIFRAEVRDARRGGSPPIDRLIVRFLSSWILVVGSNEVFFVLASQFPEDPRGWAAGALTVAAVVGNLLSLTLDRRHRGLHDLLTGTWVVHRQPELLDRSTDDQTVAPLDREELRRLAARGERIGRTMVLDSLGQGGMGQVYRGYDETLDRQVAVKVLKQDLGAEPGFEERFVREARLLAGLSHPNVVQLYHFGVDDDQPYFTMELIPGPSLAEHLKGAPVPEEQAVTWMLQACEGLAAAKQRDIIHRDIKPSNMILTPSQMLKMVDFGMAKMHAAPGEDSQNLTATGVVMGTPHYMSPEQGQGEDTDHRSDIYSLGATFYHLLTGEYPFTAKTPMGVVVKHITAPFPEEPLKSCVSRELFAVIQKMMAKHPSQRFQTYDELGAALQRLRPGQLVPANIFSRTAAHLVDLGLLVLACLIAGMCVYAGLSRANHLYGTARAREIWLAWGHFAPLLITWPSFWTLLRLLRGHGTPGMSVIGLAITTRDGRPASRLRSLAWWISAPATYVSGALLLTVTTTFELGRRGLLDDARERGLLALLVVLAVPPLANALLLPFTGRSMTEWLSRTRLVYR